ncbi:MAG TPA: hypothetical protein VLE49_00165 [Anaerolineales bacterium]|nr:hypothetical protein [Anaerolineales bacterium]
MQPLVQSAIDAANRGENNTALEFCKQALAADPNDVDAWLVVAAVVEQPERKRQCLNRVLSLDPTNQIARDELLDMDRAAMGGAPPFAPEPLLPQAQPAYQAALSPSTYPTSTSVFESTPAPTQSVLVPSQVAAKPAVKARTEKPLSFRLPIWTRLPFYFSTVAAAFIVILAIIDGELGVFLGAFVLFLIMCALSLSFSFKVEVRDAGILVDTLISQSHIGWNEISEMKSGSFQHGLELKRKKGKSVKVSGAVNGYSTIVEILRQKRPDLFGGSATGEPSSFSFTETKVYKKSLLMQYGGMIIGIPLLIFSAIAILNGYSEYFFVGIFLGGYSIYLIFQPFFHASKIRIEPNRLVFEMFFGEKEFSASQIEKIWIKTVRGRYGTAFQYVMVKPVQGRAISLRGFGVGEEILYGVLMNWWSASNQQPGIKK